MTPAAPGLAAPTAAQGTHAPNPSPKDPHGSKLSPDDPRLRLRRPASRTLRTGPLVALVAALLGAVMLAVAFAFQTPSGADRHHDEASPSSTPPPPNVPETIRNASATSAKTQERAETRPVRTAAAGGSVVPDAQRLRLEQQFKAENAGILFEAAAAGGEESRTPGGDPARPTSQATVPSPPEGQGPGASNSDPNLQDRKNAFLDGPGTSKVRDSLAHTIQHPHSPYEIKAGTIIPAVLITAINSDLPGPVIGQVRENVYDTVSGNFLLIPQGARLLASYDSMVAWGQERVLLCWNRLVLPNGDSLDLECMPAADLQGAAGLTDSVDEHWFRILKGAAVASLLAATTQGIAGSTTGFNPTVPQLWANGAAGDINQVGQQLTRRNLNIQPTITVRPGFSINVMVTKDMIVPPYPASPAARGLLP